MAELAPLRDPIVLLTCVERIPEVALAPAGGPIVDVIRNSGGTATADAVAALVASQARGSRVVVVLHHTRCQFLPFTDEYQDLQLFSAFRELSVDRVRDVALAVAQTVNTLRVEPRLLFRDDVRGAVYDTARGVLLTTSPTGLWVRPDGAAATRPGGMNRCRPHARRRPGATPPRPRPPDFS